MVSNQNQDVPVLSVHDLAISYKTRKGDVNAVRNVSFEINPQETFGLVGESGCGKSTVAYAMVNSLGRNGRIVSGDILFQGKSLVGRTEAELRQMRGNDISMVFQDPMQALNPSLRVGFQLGETLIAHQNLSRSQADERSLEMLKKVHMPDPGLVMRRYPHQLSGGQQQRVIIAMALLNSPALLIMDEPTTALDVTVEAEVLDLIAELRETFNTAILYISHNLGVIARVCDRLAVMYAGEVVERSAIGTVFAHAIHPYTQGLIRCIPTLGSSKASSYLDPIPGRVPTLDNLPPGCLFEPRCDFAVESCQTRPALQEVENEHFVRCHRAQDMLENIATKTISTQAPTKEATPPTSGESILSMEQLKTHYEQKRNTVSSLFGLGKKQYIKALDGVDLEVPRGVTLGIVGESGCGKSTLAKTIVGLESPVSGALEFLGIDIMGSASSRNFDLIKELQMVFQNPDSTLNPSFSVGYQISRPLKRFKGLKGAALKNEVLGLLDSVRLGASYYNRLPRQLSGGEKQRVAIARSVATHPELIICDEPVSALDVSVQAAILNLLLDLQRENGLTMLFISHDLSVVRFFSDYVAVMYLGKLCEVGPSEEIYGPPYHPYTEALLSAVPIPDPSADQKRIRLTGTVPSALNPPSGCRFHTRCPRMMGEICRETEPPGQMDKNGHIIYCHIPLEELATFEPVLQNQDGRTG